MVERLDQILTSWGGWYRTHVRIIPVLRGCFFYDESIIHHRWITWNSSLATLLFKNLIIPGIMVFKGLEIIYHKILPMALSSFAIQFQFSSNPRDGVALRKKQHVYQANIHTLSKGFKLFEVTGIRKITKSRIVELPGAYYLTSYPLSYAGSQTWKDAVTTDSD